eukprot:TRINITY_DN72253_c0_g1_i1.p1 TRINITY_DN72253_c0_g1~~TRINITY_DN72253_c0_g1_i1.p1  ORF type:complete len:212 (-),score=9.27 TRINITY_DN72253_c0_g1_i1:219-854(-)
MGAYSLAVCATTTVLGALVDTCIYFLLMQVDDMRWTFCTLIAKCVTSASVVFAIKHHLLEDRGALCAVCFIWACFTIGLLVIGFGETLDQTSIVKCIVILATYRVLDICALSLFTAIFHVVDVHALIRHDRVLRTCRLRALQKSKGDRDCDQSTIYCSVCIGELSSNSLVAVFRCQHVAHLRCSQAWLSAPWNRRYASSRQCPVHCREAVV